MLSRNDVERSSIRIVKKLDSRLGTQMNWKKKTILHGLISKAIFREFLNKPPLSYCSLRWTNPQTCDSRLRWRTNGMVNWEYGRYLDDFLVGKGTMRRLYQHVLYYHCEVAVDLDLTFVFRKEFWRPQTETNHWKRVNEENFWPKTSNCNCTRINLITSEKRK